MQVLSIIVTVIIFALLAFVIIYNAVKIIQTLVARHKEKKASQEQNSDNSDSNTKS